MKTTKAVFLDCPTDLVPEMGALFAVFSPAYHGQPLSAFSWLLIGVIVD